MAPAGRFFRLSLWGLAASGGLVAAAVCYPDWAGASFPLSLALLLLSGMGCLMSGEVRRAAGGPGGQARGGQRGLGVRLALAAALATAAVLVLAAGLFFLLPRTAESARRHLRGARGPGFSSQVALGGTSRLRTSSRAVMHVRVFGDLPRDVKWRGMALTEFDGRVWRAAPDERSERIAVVDGEAVLTGGPAVGRRVNYQVDLETAASGVLFFAGTPLRVAVRAPALWRTATGNYRVDAAADGSRYDVYSVFDEAVVGPAPESRRYLQLPALDARIPELAARLTSGAATAYGRARALEAGLQREYSYTEDPPKRSPRDPLADFLFERRAGHCEYFASAMAIMLRTLGIPARVVTGFQSGVWNPISELHVVRLSDAHSWVEAWIEDRGWTPFDPTPPAAAPAAGLAAKLALYLDAAETFWNEWVAGYDVNRQGLLANNLELAARRAGGRWLDQGGGAGLRWGRRIALWLREYGGRVAWPILALVAAALMAKPAWRLLHTRRRVRRARLGRAQAGDATLLYRRMLDLMRRRGCQKPDWFTPREFAASLPPSGARLLVDEFTAAYQAARFGGRMEEAARLPALLDRLRRQPQ
jgi:transglutaminase-like putative cysteine protease